MRWTRLSCHSFRHNAVRLQLHALAYNLANFLRSLALPQEVEQWSLTTLRHGAPGSGRQQRRRLSSYRPFRASAVRRRDEASGSTIIAECSTAGSSRLACLSDLLRTAERGLAEAEAKAVVEPVPAGRDQARRGRGAGRHQHRRLAGLP